MSLETGTYISDLISTNPTSTDLASFGDDHLRLIKSTLLATFPNANGAVNPSVAEFNYLVGVTSAIQTQLDAKLATATAPGAGLTESAGVLDVGAGDGIAVAADAVAVDISSLTAIEGNALAATDGMLVDDSGVMKRVSYQNAGAIVPAAVTSSGNKVFVSTEMNQVWRYNNASSNAFWDIDTGVGVQGNWLVIIQEAAGQVTLQSGTATINFADGHTGTRTSGSVIVGWNVGGNEWYFTGDSTVV